MLTERPTLKALLRHAKMMSDYEIERDFEDCLVPLADPAGQETLMNYKRARKAAPGYQPISNSHMRTGNNHKNIRGAKK